MRLAAIDIGSNAARLLISEVTEHAGGKADFNKLNLVRVPLRLGLDVFEQGVISEYRIGLVMHCMHAYRHLMNFYEIDDEIACATSAMRDAANSTEIIQRVQSETGIAIDVISGDLEASIIYENHIAEKMDDENGYLYVDVGGGSTELTFFSQGKLVFKQSFNIGTIRLLKNLVEDETWDTMKEFIKDNIAGHKNISAIGTGGNINKVFSLSKRKDGKPLPLELLRDYYKELSNVSLEDRMKMYHLREDRADVIVPALQIYVNVLRWANAEEIYVPKIGLADGLVQHLYATKKKSQVANSKY